MKLEEIYSHYSDLTHALDDAARDKDIYCCIHWDAYPYLRIMFGRHGVYFADWQSRTNILRSFHNNSATRLCVLLLEEYITNEPVKVVEL